MDYFPKHFKDTTNYNIVSQLNVIRQCPSFFPVEEGLHIGKHVTLVEVEGVSRSISVMDGCVLMALLQNWLSQPPMWVQCQD